MVVVVVNTEGAPRARSPATARAFPADSESSAAGEPPALQEVLADARPTARALRDQVGALATATRRKEATYPEVAAQCHGYRLGSLERTAKRSQT